MYGLLREVKKLRRIVNPISGKESIIVFAVTIGDKQVEQTLPKEWINLEFEPFLPCELPDKLGKAKNLGGLEKLCKKHGYGLDIIPVETLGNPWEDEE